jgi:hypothetical protein
MSENRQDYKWLESHINSASNDVAAWPSWKSQGSTIIAFENRTNVEHVNSERIVEPVKNQRQR